MHPDCEDGRRLLDSYLLALASRDQLVKSPCEETSAEEAKLIQEQLLQARQRYWRHVQRHRCRKLSDIRTAEDTEEELRRVLRQRQEEWAIAPEDERAAARQRVLTALCNFNSYILHGELPREK